MELGSASGGLTGCHQVSRCTMAGRKGVGPGLLVSTVGRQEPTHWAGWSLTTKHPLLSKGQLQSAPIFGAKMLSTAGILGASFGPYKEGGAPKPLAVPEIWCPCLEQHHTDLGIHLEQTRKICIHPSSIQSFYNASCSSWGRAPYSGAVQRFLSPPFWPASGPLLLTTAPQFPFEDSLSPAKMPHRLLPCHQRVIT